MDDQKPTDQKPTDQKPKIDPWPWLDRGYKAAIIISILVGACTWIAPHAGIVFQIINYIFIIALPGYYFYKHWTRRWFLADPSSQLLTGAMAFLNSSIAIGAFAIVEGTLKIDPKLFIFGPVAIAWWVLFVISLFLAATRNSRQLAMQYSVAHQTLLMSIAISKFSSCISLSIFLLP